MCIFEEGESCPVLSFRGAAMMMMMMRQCIAFWDIHMDNDNHPILTRKRNVGFPNGPFILSSKEWDGKRLPTRRLFNTAKYNHRAYFYCTTTKRSQPNRYKITNPFSWCRLQPHHKLFPVGFEYYLPEIKSTHIEHMQFESCVVSYIACFPFFFLPLQRG